MVVKHYIHGNPISRKPIIRRAIRRKEVARRPVAVFRSRRGSDKSTFSDDAYSRFIWNLLKISLFLCIIACGYPALLSYLQVVVMVLSAVLLARMLITTVVGVCRLVGCVCGAVFNLVKNVVTHCYRPDVLHEVVNRSLFTATSIVLCGVTAVLRHVGYVRHMKPLMLFDITTLMLGVLLDCMTLFLYAEISCNNDTDIKKTSRRVPRMEDLLVQDEVCDACGHRANNDIIDDRSCDNNADMHPQDDDSCVVRDGSERKDVEGGVLHVFVPDTLVDKGIAVTTLSHGAQERMQR